MRPSQKEIVAMTIATPGMPNAQAGPKPGLSSSQGQSSVEMKLPALIEK